MNGFLSRLGGDILVDDLPNLFRLLDSTLFRSLLDLVDGRHDGVEIRRVQQLCHSLPLVNERSLLIVVILRRILLLLDVIR